MSVSLPVFRHVFVFVFVLVQMYLLSHVDGSVEGGAQRGAQRREISHRWHLATGIPPLIMRGGAVGMMMMRRRMIRIMPMMMMMMMMTMSFSEFLRGWVKIVVCKVLSLSKFIFGTDECLWSYWTIVILRPPKVEIYRSTVSTDVLHKVHQWATILRVLPTTWFCRWWRRG